MECGTNIFVKHMNPELEKYLNENRDKLIGFITHKTGDPVLSEDLLQESLLKALRASGELKEKDKVVSWFYQIIRNAITDVYRKQGREAMFTGNNVPEWQEELAPDEEKTLCQCFISLIPALNPDYAFIIKALELGNEDPDEVASKLGISRNNLKVKRYRARQQLRERLEQTCRTCATHGCMDCTCADS